MKFTYDEKEDRGECVAYVDKDGDLILKTECGQCVWVASHGVYLHHFAFDECRATRKFYPSDKITIEF